MATTNVTGQYVDLGGEVPVVSAIAVGAVAPGSAKIGPFGTSAGTTTTLSASTPVLMSGSGTPGSMVATIGSIYLRTDGGTTTSTRLFINTTGTAWVGLISES